MREITYVKFVEITSLYLIAVIVKKYLNLSSYIFYKRKLLSFNLIVLLTVGNIPAKKNVLNLKYSKDNYNFLLC